MLAFQWRRLNLDSTPVLNGIGQLFVLASNVKQPLAKISNRQFAGRLAQTDCLLPVMR